jgi:hypothetical protein
MKAIQVPVVLGFVLAIVGGGRLAQAQILVDSDFNASSDSAALRANSAGQDWYESRQDVPTLLTLDRTSVGGNATAKAKFTASSTGNAYLTQEFSSPQTQAFSVQWDIYVDSILDISGHPDCAGWMLIGDDTITNTTRKGPNADDSERFVYMAFYKDGGGTSGTMSLVAMERDSTTLTPIATGLYLKQWYTMKVDLNLANDTYDVYVDGNKVVGAWPSRNLKDSVTYISFAQWNDGAGSFYVDNVTASAGGCGSRCGLLPGDRVTLLTNNPRGATGLAAGTQGTVICDSDVKSGAPLFVSWDGWTNGVNTDNFCQCTPYPYASNSGWWVYCEDVEAGALGNEIVVFDKTWRGGGIVGCENYIPDLGQWAQSWVVGSAPAGARVTGVSYLVTVVSSSDVGPNFRCSDYEIGLSSTERGGTANYLLVWDNAGGATDQNLDDDTANDYDIELSRTTNAFNGQSVNQTWYFRLIDTVSGVELKGTGCFTHLKLVIHYETLLCPSVTTQTATGVQCSSATLNGKVVDDGGQACQYRFRYKKEGGSYTETTWTGSKRTGESFSQTITGLSSGAKYYFAAQVKNSSCERPWGAELTFTTRQLLAETQAATDIRCTTATLNGRVADDGGQACQYRFRYMKTGGSYSYTAYAGSKQTGETFSQAMTGLEQGTKYYFAAQVNNSTCESTWGSDLTFTTLKPPTATAEAATGITVTEATLNGRLTDDGGATCQYRFRYGTGDGSYTETAWTGSIRGAGLAFSQAISGLSKGTKYYFAAQAKNEGCEGPWSPELRLTTLTVTVTKPKVATQFPTNVQDTTATLRGKIVSDGNEPCEYRFWYQKGPPLTLPLPEPGSRAPRDVISIQEESGAFTPWTGAKRTGELLVESIDSLEPNTAYNFAAQARNSAGESDLGMAWPFKTTFTDMDKDGLRDQYESYLLNRFRPYFLFSNYYYTTIFGETIATPEHYNPADVCWYIARSELLVSGDEDSTVVMSNDILSQNPAAILSFEWETYGKANLLENRAKTDYHINPLEDWNGDDSNPGRHGESWDVILQRRNVGLYGHVVRANTDYQKGMPQRNDATYAYLKIEYWQFFGYNNANQDFDIADHEGDWATVQLLYDPGNDQIVSVFHYAHGKEMRFDLNRATNSWTMLGPMPPFLWYREYQGPHYGTFTLDRPAYDDWGHPLEPDVNDNTVRFNIDLDTLESSGTLEFSHPVVYIEYGSHEFWPTASGVYRDFQLGVEAGRAPPHNGLDWDHCYLTGDVPNLGEVGHPLAEVEGAKIILNYNGYWGAFSRLNSPPPGPPLHTEWTWPADDPNRTAINPDDFED